MIARQKIVDYIVERFGLDREFVRRRVNIFLTLVPLTEAQLETIHEELMSIQRGQQRR